MRPDKTIFITIGDKMRAYLKYGLAALILLGSLLLLGLYPYRAALLPPADEPGQLRDALARHLKLFIPPDGNRPFPTVLAFHGCGGQRESMVDDLTSWLLPAGFAVLLSTATRHAAFEDWQPVCDGKRLWGNERAQDVYAALALAAQMPEIDRQRLALLGFSHGGWAILDALAYGGASGMASPSPDQAALTLVQAAVTFTPTADIRHICGSHSQAPGKFAAADAAGRAGTVSPTISNAWTAWTASSLSRIQLVLYADGRSCIRPAQPDEYLSAGNCRRGPCNKPWPSFAKRC